MLNAVSICRFSIWLLFFSIFCSSSGIGVATALLVLSAGWIFRRDFFKLPSLPLFWPILTLVVALGLSIALAHGDGFAKAFLKLRYLSIYFFLLLCFHRFPEIRNKLAIAAVPFSMLLAVVAILQFTGVFCPMLASGLMGGELAEWSSSGRLFFHARGLLYHHNPFAYTLLILFFLMLGQALTAPSQSRRRMFHAGIAAALICVVLSGSRGGWLSLLVAAMALFVVVGRSHWRLFVGLATVGVALATVFSRPLIERGSTLQLSQNQERVRLWQISWQMFLDHPVFGTGYHRGFELNREKYMTPEDKANPRFPTDPHSLYFDLLATTGIVGLGAFLYFAIATLLSYLQGLHRTRAPDERAMLIAGLGSFVCFLVGTGFDSHFFHTQTLMGTLFALGLGQSGKSVRKY